MTGKDFREKVEGLKTVNNPKKEGDVIDVVGNMKKFKDVLKHLRVLAICSPEDKLLLVTGIQ